MFISIRWKAVLLLSMIMLLITMAWIAQSVYSNLHVYSEKTKQDELRYQNVLDQLISDNYLKLSQFGQLIGSYSYIKSSNTNSDQKALQDQLSSQWFELNLSVGMDYISVADAQGKVIVEAHQFLGEESLEQFHSAVKVFSSTTGNQKINSFVFCNEHCLQVVTEPFFFKNGEQGYLILGQNMSDLIARYALISESDIAILIQRPPTKTSNHYIDNWNGQIWAASNFSETFERLKNYSLEHSEVNGLNQDSLIWHEWNKSIRIANVIPRNYFQVGYPAKYVSLIDNSIQQQLLRKEIITQVLTGLAGWLFAVILLMIVMLGPIQRVLTVVRALSFLPKQEFEKAKSVLVRKQTTTRDELTELEDSTLLLTHELNQLQEQVSHSKDKLREQVLAVTRSKDFLQRLFDNANLFILTQDLHFTNCDSNYLFSKSFDTSEINHFTDLMVNDSDKNIFENGVTLLSDGQRERFQQEALMTHLGEESIIVAWTHTLVENENGENRILSIGMDITKRKEDEKALKWLANNDSLTKIGNRRAFHENLQKLLSLHEHGAIVFIDVNRFKQINDIYGHSVGDKVLIDIANKLQSHIRHGDSVSRLAGDEFTLLLPGVSEQNLPSIVENLTSELKGSLQLSDGRKVDYSGSVGAALFPLHGEDEQTLIVHSDMAMYQAKKKGLNNWHIFDFADDSLQELKDEHWLMNLLQDALKKDRFNLNFQPILSLKTKRVSHYEVLLRFTTQEGQKISPDRFIKVAERVGLIHEVDTWVFKTLLSTLSNEGLIDSDLKFAVNISAPSLQDRYFAQKIYDITEQQNIAPQQLIIELTETAYIDNLDQVLSNLRYLHTKGFAIALDDFGVGFSSFSYLKQLPLDYVKLDGSYVQNLPDNIENQAFIESVVIMTKAFGMQTIAEYVEDQATTDILKEIDVDYVQGYYFGKPKPELLNSEQVREALEKL